MICSDAGVDLVAHDREARDAVLVGGVGQRRVGEVQVPGGGEVRRELDAEQAVLLAQRDRDAAGLDRGLGARPPDHHAAVALDVEDPPVGGDVELQRVLGVVVERDLLEVGRAGRGHALGTAVRRGGARHRPDAAEQVLRGIRGSPNELDRVAHARVPRVAAVEVRAPRDRVVVVVAVGAVALAVGRLVDRGQDVDVVARAVVGAGCGAGGRRLVVVPLVRARPAGGNASPWRDARCPRRRPRRSACRPGGRRSSPRRGRRTSPSRTRCRRPHGCRRSRCRPRM